MGRKRGKILNIGNKFRKPSGASIEPAPVLTFAQAVDTATQVIESEKPTFGSINSPSHTILSNLSPNNLKYNNGGNGHANASSAHHFSTSYCEPENFHDPPEFPITLESHEPSNPQYHSIITSGIFPQTSCPRFTNDENVCDSDNTVAMDHISSTLPDLSPAKSHISHGGKPCADESELPEDIRQIPLEVREAVTFDDDPTLPAVTFRYFILSILFVGVGAFVSQLATFRSTSVPFSPLFVQIISHYLGTLLATLPAWKIGIPWTRFQFSLNPGPWNVKEHVLVTITAASGATSCLAANPIILSNLYYDKPINTYVAIPFMLSVVLIGYSYAGLARSFVLYEPSLPWHRALMHSQVFETLRRSTRQDPRQRRRRAFFLAAVAFMAVWQMLPEYVFPMLSSVAMLCWVMPKNATANFIGSGLGGMGVLNLSLNWSHISAHWMNPLIVPFWATVLVTLAYVIQCWILIPLMKWSPLNSYKQNLMSNRLWTTDGKPYPFEKLLTADKMVDTEALARLGPVQIGSHYASTIFFDFAAFTSAFSWMAMFGRSTISQAIRKCSLEGHHPLGIYWSYSDRLNVLMREYRELPTHWFLALFIAATASIGMILTQTTVLELHPTVFAAALLVGAIVIIPMAWLYALSSFQVATGTVNALIYGILVDRSGTQRHPVGASTYMAVAGGTWYRAQHMLQDMKIAHFMHVAPRTVFFSQLFGAVIGVPINYIAIQWAMNESGREQLLGQRNDPQHQWTGQAYASLNALTVLFVIIGPRRLMQEASRYALLPWGCVLGAMMPVTIYVVHRRWPRCRADLFNTTILFSALAYFYGNVSTGYSTRFFIALSSLLSSKFGNFFRARRLARRARRKAKVSMRPSDKFKTMWGYAPTDSSDEGKNDVCHDTDDTSLDEPPTVKRYSYLLGAAFDAGSNISLFVLFVLVLLLKRKMPEWWGNRHDSVERCFALHQE